MMRQQGVMPDAISYSALISACEKGNQVKRAQEFFEIMDQQGVVPDAINFNALISAFEKGNQLEQAVELFRRMCK